MRNLIFATLALALFAVSARAEAPSHPGRIQIEADGSRTLVHEVVVSARSAEVWTAISTPEGWRTWAVPYAARDSANAEILETSYDPQARPGDPASIRQEIVASLPERLLVFRTVRAPPGFPHAEAYYNVTSFFELTPDGAGTRVRLSGAGYPAGAAGDALLGFFRTGNQTTLDALRSRFDIGPIDWEERLRQPAP